MRSFLMEATIPTDPAGNYTLPPIYVALAGTTILAAQHNGPLEDLAQAMSSRLMRDGRNGMVGNFNLGSFRGVNAAPGTSPTDLATVSQGIPIGGLLDFAGTSAPDGWLLCAGQAVSRSTYAALFTVLGTAFGNGNGSTTFNVPDLRGRVVAGLDNMNGSNANRLTTMSSTTRGQSGGSADHTLTAAQMPSHNHSFSGTTGNAGAHEHGVRVSDGGGFSGSTVAAGSLVSTATYNATLSAGNHSHPFSGTTGSAGSGNAHSITQPTMVMNKIIRATF